MNINTMLTIIYSNDIKYVWSYATNYQHIQLIANWVTIISAIGILYTIVTYTHNILREQKKDQETNIIRSIKLINNFNKIMPYLKHYNQNYQTEYKKLVTQKLADLKQHNPKLNINSIKINKKQIEENLKLREFKVGAIINALNAMAIYITNDVYDEQLIKNHLATDILKFYSDQTTIINDLEKYNQDYNDMKTLIHRWEEYQ